MDRASRQRIDVTDGLESTLVMLGHKLRTGVTVVRDYGGDVPMIEAYAGELNQVWTNLVDNAVDAMDGGGTLRLSTRARRRTSVVVEVGDSGTGMTPQVAARAFEAFYTTKDVGAGTGLGLDIARRIVVERHRGEIAVDSRPGDTVMRVRLPVELPGVTRHRDAAATRGTRGGDTLPLAPRLDLGQLDRRRRRDLPPVLPPGAAGAGRPGAAARARHDRSRDVARPRDWTYHGDALRPRPTAGTTSRCGPGRWSRGDDGVWRMYYTALIHRRATACTTSGSGWRSPTTCSPGAGSTDRPLVRPTRAGTGRSTRTARRSETWRDPFVFRDPDGDGWHMLITARARGRAAAARRRARPRAQRTTCVAWEVRPPVCRDPARLRADRGAAGARGRRAAGARRSPATRGAEPARKAEHGRYCTWSVAGEPGGSLTGPWDVSAAVPFRAEPTLFAAPLVQQRDGGWAPLGFRNREPEGILSFEIIDPAAGARRGRRPASPLTPPAG